MNYLKAGIFFFVCWLVQTTLLWRVWPFDASPNLPLCAAVCFSWLYDRNYGLVYAILFGILLDLQTQTLFGVTALALVLCCVPAFILRLYFNPERALPCALAALIATPVCLLTVWGFYHLFGSPVSLLSAIRTLPSLLISQSLISLILHLLFVRTIIHDKKDRRYTGSVV